MVRILNNGIVTRLSLANMGYDLKIACQQCGAAVDNIKHRCYTCPHVYQRAMANLGADLFDEAVGAPEDGLLFTRAMMAPPTSHLPDRLPHPMHRFVNMSRG